MKRKLRTEVLVKDYLLCENLAQEIKDNYRINVLEPANTCLVMAKVKESVGKTEFYLCEVLCTEARVSVHDALGIGILMGDNKEHALNLAVIDAAINAELEEAKGWDERLNPAKEKMEKRQRDIFSVVEKSKVKFDIMEEYFDGIGKKS